MDFFKQINDLYGHVFGDAALQKFVLELSKCIRQYDIPGRFGVVEYACSAEEHIDNFVTRADNNTYVAKNKGNSKYYS